MARLTNTSKKPKKKKLTKAQLRERSEQRRKLLAVGLRGGLVASVIAGSIIGFHAVSDHVRADLSVPTSAPTMVLLKKPTWMTQVIADDICASISPPSPRSTLDESLLKEIYAKLQQNAWVDQVGSVRRVRDEETGADTLEVLCSWRQPSAIVLSNEVHDGDEWAGVHGRYHLVANTEDGPVLLPLAYGLDEINRIVHGTDASATNLKVVLGVDTKPPAVGGVWQGVALQAGVEVAEMLMNEPKAVDITAIDVGNVRYEEGDSRLAREKQRNPMFSPVVLRTRYDTIVNWGRRPQARDFLVEAPPAKKLQHLGQLHDTFGRQGRYPDWADIRTDVVKYKPLPAAR
ncbi:MAG: hypothetical protein AAGK78_02090 [Planctomycetota bacterium]